jgi:hypothetical protein
MDLKQHLANRQRFPIELMRLYNNKHVAWNLEGTKILGADTNPLRLVACMEAAGYDSSQYVVAFMDAADDR